MSIPTVELDGVPNPIPEELPVLDVREDFEWEAGHIEGALHIPLGDLPGRVGELPGGQILVTCKMGGRSAQAVMWLSQQGHDVVNLAGGMAAWEAAGRPMVSDTGTPPQVL